MRRSRWRAVGVAVLGIHATGLGYAAEPTNPADEHLTVMPKGSPHFAVARGETVVQVHAIGPWGLTYVDPKDDPRTRR